VNKVPVHFIFCVDLMKFKILSVNGNILYIGHLIFNLQGGQELTVLLIKLIQNVYLQAICPWYTDILGSGALQHGLSVVQDC